METIKYTHYGIDYELGIYKGTYLYGGTLAMELYDITDGEPFSDITVNLPGYAHDNVQYVDTNDFPQIEQIIEEYRLGKKVGETSTGWCTYPLYEFDMEEVEKYVKEME